MFDQFLEILSYWSWELSNIWKKSLDIGFRFWSWWSFEEYALTFSKYFQVPKKVPHEVCDYKHHDSYDHHGGYDHGHGGYDHGGHGGHGGYDHGGHGDHHGGYDHHGGGGGGFGDFGPGFGGFGGGFGGFGGFGDGPFKKSLDTKIETARSSVEGEKITKKSNE